MSTKTTFKRVALTSVVALVAGLVSVAPANAAITLPMWIDTATSVGGVAVTANTSTVTRTLNTQVNAAAVSAITAPAGSAIIFTVKTGGSFVTTNIIDMSINGTVVQSDTTLGTAATAVTTTRNLPSPTTTTTYNYLLKVYATATTRVAATDVVDLPIAITVVPASDFSAGVSTQYLTNSVAGGDTGTSATDAAFPAVSKATGALRAKMTVALNRADATAYAAGTYYVSVDGPGFVDIDAAGTSTAAGGAGTLRSTSLASDGAFAVLIYGDGTSGVATIKSYVLLADGVTKVSLPDKKVHFYGTVATLTATVLQPVASVGAANGCTTANTCTQATLLLTPAIVVSAKDSNGELVPGLTVTASPTDSSVVASATATAVTGTTDKNGFGYYNSAITGGAVGMIGKSTTLVYKTVVDANTTIISAPVTVYLGGSPATVALSLDKASYAPGEKATLTVSVKDSAGNKAADGTYANLFAGASSSNLSVQGTTPGASVEVVNGVATYTIYAPASGTSFTVSNTADTSVAAAGRIKVSATASVATANDALLNSLITKINALAKIIAKIQKKLGVK